MKGYSEIVRYKFKAGILLGFMAAFAILFSELSSFQYRQAAAIQAKADKAGDYDDKAQEVLEVGKHLVAHVSQLIIVQEWHFLGDIYTIDHQDQEPGALEVRGYNTWFKTLFRLIISPNAP